MPSIYEKFVKCVCCSRYGTINYTGKVPQVVSKKCICGVTTNHIIKVSDIKDKKLIKL